MKFQLISDIHGEQFKSYWQLPVGEDEKNTILLLAGDIGVAKRPTTFQFLLEDASERFAQVVYIMGNHEHYGSCFNETDAKIKKIIVGKGWSNVHFDKQLKIETGGYGGYSIIAASLWTDINKNNPGDRAVVGYSMNDYHQTKFRTSSPTQPREVRPMNVDDTLEQHYRDRDFIFSQIELAMREDRKIVVMTHHAPSSRSIHEKYKGSSLNAGFYSEMTEQIHALDYEMIWCHGHTHTSFDYNIGKCRVVCNPHGYFGTFSNYGLENPEFNPLLIL